MKKNWLMVGIAIGLIILTVGVVAIVRLKKQSILSPLGETPTQKVQLSSWEDPAGFKFSYPAEVKIDPHEEDTLSYAHLELTTTNHSGGILIWMKDTNYKNLEDWTKKEATSGVQVFDSELGGKPAKKIALTNPKKLIVAAIDVDVLVLIEVMPEDKWWEETFNQIASSFEFIPLEGEPTSAAPGAWEGTGGGGGVIEEEEEIVE